MSGALALATSVSARQTDSVQGGVDLRRAAQRRRLVAGPRRRAALRPEEAGRQGRDDLQGEHPEQPGPAGRGEPRSPGLQDHLRRRRSGTSRPASTASSTRSTRARYFEQATGTAGEEEPGRVLRRRARTRSTCPGIAAGAATKNGTIGYIVPFGIPEVVRHANAFALGAQVAHPGAKVKLIWTNSWVLAAGREEGGAEPDRRRRGRARAERGHPDRRPVRRVEGHPLGRLRLRREQVRAQVVVDGGRLQLGAVLPEAREGGHERHVEVGLLLRLDQGRVHGPGQVRPEGLGQDEGADREVQAR